MLESLISCLKLSYFSIGCLKTQFRCYDKTRCINESLVCDNVQHCEDNSDEKFCITREKRISENLLEDTEINYENTEFDYNPVDYEYEDYVGNYRVAES